MATKIEWCDETINPVIGCSKCSPACLNCYAERMAARWAKHPNPKISDKYGCVVDRNGHWNDQVVISLDPFMRLPKRGRVVFLVSMGDVFHEDVPVEIIDQFFVGMRAFNQHQYLILTKRHQRMKDVLDVIGQKRAQTWPWPLNNVWLGVTICAQAEADEKIPILLKTQAAHYFVSIEPMLGPVDISPWLRCKSSRRGVIDPKAYVKSHDTAKLDWVICGGETGPGSRPMQPAWVRSLRDQCRDAEIPFFFKGWGDWCPSDFQYIDGCCNKTNGRYHYIFDEKCQGLMRKLGKKVAGRTLDGIQHNEKPF